MIRTHVLEMIDGCKVWRWEWLTGAQWSALRHVTEVVIALGCAGGPIDGVLPAGPGGTGYLPPSVASLSPPGGAGVQLPPLYVPGTVPDLSPLYTPSPFDVGLVPAGGPMGGVDVVVTVETPNPLVPTVPVRNVDEPGGLLAVWLMALSFVTVKRSKT